MDKFMRLGWWAVVLFGLVLTVYAIWLVGGG
jgi:hypothetical protein